MRPWVGHGQVFGVDGEPREIDEVKIESAIAPTFVALAPVVVLEGAKHVMQFKRGERRVGKGDCIQVARRIFGRTINMNCHRLEIARHSDDGHPVVR